MFLIFFRKVLYPQQMFPSLHSPRNIMDDNVSLTSVSSFAMQGLNVTNDVISFGAQFVEK